MSTTVRELCYYSMKLEGANVSLIIFISLNELFNLQHELILH